MCPPEVCTLFLFLSVFLMSVSVPLSVPVATLVKGYDEDSVASLSTTQDEAQDTHAAENGVTNSSSHPFRGGGYMLAASYWPKVNCCSFVLNPATVAEAEMHSAMKSGVSLKGEH